MNSDEILNKIYEFINNGIKIWVNKQGNIGLLVPNLTILTEDQNNFIKDYKKHIIEFLLDNKIYSKNVNRLIFEYNVTTPRLSFAQERLWFIEEYEEGTNAYNIPMVYKILSEVRIDLLEQSIESIINRHEILRTLIKKDDKGHSYQEILNLQEHPIEIQKIQVTNQLALDNHIKTEVNHVYNLTNEYPIRITLYELVNDNERLTQDKEYYLNIVIHHIAFDGWSADIFLRELQVYYDYYLKLENGIDGKLDLPELTIQYKDFAIWQRNYLSGDRLDEQLGFWRDKLDGYETLALISDYPRPVQLDYEGSDVYFEISEDVSLSLRELAKELKVSLYSLLLSAYYLMLRSYTNQNDLVVGTPIANRHYNQIENLIGFFVNSLASRIKIDQQSSIKEFIQNVGEEVISAQLHQDLPFEKLVEELKVEKDSSRHPIFQVMFGIGGFGTNTNEQISKNNGEVLLQKYIATNSMYNIAKFDISTFIDDSKQSLRGSFNYRVKLYRKETIEEYINTYIQVLSQFAKLRDTKFKLEEVKVRDITYVDNKQYEKIIREWNKTDKDYPSDKTIQALFEEQVEKSEDSIALVYEDKQLSYKELNERSNQLAHYLIRYHGVRADKLVALCLDRSEHMLIAILAVLKAGGAYVPMDPEYPDERIKYITRDTGSAVVITNDIYQDRLEGIVSGNNDNASNATIKILAIDSEELGRDLSTQGKTNPSTDTSSNNLAYVIYTSGTTGNPKGVMIAHKGVRNTILAQVNYLSTYVTEEESVSYNSFINYTADACTLGIFSSLLSSNKLIIHNPLVSNLPNYFNINKFNIVVITPTLLPIILKALSSKKNILIIGGEKLDSSTLNVLINSKIKILQEYGVTEASVTSLVNNITNDNIHLGSPIFNTRCYVLDNNLAVVPVGGVGELYIGGAGLARGYLNRPDLAAEKFIANPFLTQEEQYSNKNTRLYKTGDLVRWLPDGNLEYIGRNDFQVKIRGYRIELGEIENALSTYDGIKQSVVLAREQISKIDDRSTGNKYLVGYYVSELKLNEDNILKYLQEKLPEYMVPNVLVHLSNLPLTVNGKLDRKALPEPELVNKDSYVAPRNELEKKLCNIWSEVLGLPADKVGISDDFFRLGGDSIVSIQLVSRIRNQLELAVSVKDIFNNRTIERLYENVFNNEKDNKVKLSLKTEQGILTGDVPLLPIQEWFFISDLAIPNYWNQSFLVKTPKLDLDRLKVSIRKLIEHHDSFRLRYKFSKNTIQTPIQYYNNGVIEEELKILDIRTLKLKEDSREFNDKLQKILTDWQSNFNLEDGPVYSIGYIYGYQDNSSRIFFALHHLIVDTVSWRILIEDLNAIYNQKKLPAKGSSYRQWVETVKHYADTNEQEKLYWEGVLLDHNDTLTELVETEDTCNYISFQLDSDQTNRLLKESGKAYNTHINDILLNALGYTLFELTSKKVNHIVLEGHGREEIDINIDVTKTLGWFTTMYPVRLELQDNIGDSIKTIKENLRKIPNKGIGYGALIGYKQRSLPRISFNYLGQFDKETVNEQQTQELWKLVNEGSGISVDPKNQDHNIFNINGLVLDNKLQFSITSKLDVTATQKLCDVFKNKLIEIINYTTNQNRSYLTVSDIGSIISQEYLDRIQKVREVEAVYLANSLQQGFIYHALNQGDIDDAYRVQLVWQYNNELEVDKLKAAWGYAQQRFSSLRLRFAWEEELIQIIDKDSSIIDWNYIDLSKEDLKAQELSIKELQEKDRSIEYKLEQGNLFRIYLIKQKDNLYTCIFSNHHAILDGWSGPILLGYIHETYLDLLDEKKFVLLIDRNYERTQQYLQEHRYSNQDYWNKYVSQLDDRGDLSGLLKEESRDVKIEAYRHITTSKEELLMVSGDLYYGLKQISQEAGVTLNAILQYAWHKVLRIYGNSNQTIVGTIVSGRNLPVDGIENSVGLHINTLTLIVNHEVESNKKIIDEIVKVQNDINELNSRSDINLGTLQAGLGERLFESLFVYENYPVPNSKDQEKRIKVVLKDSVEKLDYPLTVIAYEGNKQLHLILKYAGELFSNDTIKEVLVVINKLLVQIAKGSFERVKSLSYLDNKQYEKIIREWNKTDKDYPSDKTIQALFEEQVEKSGDSIALVYENKQLSYKELNERSNQLAHYLIRYHGVRADKLVALCLDRSEHMLIAILAVLKAGGAYVPMDPEYPDERIKYITRDTGSAVVITNDIYQDRLEGIVSGNNDNASNATIKILAIDSEELSRDLSTQGKANPSTDTSSNNLAYVIYTSGTTGNPKGVMIEHKGVANRIGWMNYMYPLNKTDRVLQKTSYVFDVSVWELLWANWYGSCLVITHSQKYKDNNYITKLIAKELITIAHFVPVMLNTFLEEINTNLKDAEFDISQLRNSLKHLFCSGEALQLNQVQKSNGIFLPTTIHNLYGPTEVSIDALYYNINNIDKLIIPIGKQISNIKVYVLDSNLAVVPVGGVGELYIGGAGLARGYLNRPDLAAEKFIANPFLTQEEQYSNKNTRLYKTGDLVRWLPDGNLEYIGRNDFQVKIRGYRIELGEIENALSTYDGIKQSVVLAREQISKIDGNSTGNKYLVGYYVSKPKLNEDNILKYLQEKLPEYMVPNVLVHLDKLLLTVNGKLDRKALPEPELVNKDSYIAPRNELEEKLCNIWAEVLGLSYDKVGINDDFFRLGGNSILAIRLVSITNKELSCRFNITIIFKHRNINDYSRFIREQLSKLDITYHKRLRF